MAPTNVTRTTGRPGPTRATRPANLQRLIVIRAGRAIVRARLLATPTANRIWEALPLHSTIETWGGAVHFKLPFECGRERGARPTVDRGAIAFWSEEGRVIIAFAMTPISGAGELRLPAPSNVWAESLDDVEAFASVRAGTEVSIRRVDAESSITRGQ